ncbi:hypothetical protein NEOKW01_1681 [Nematocida sp. AWRm80]|nr:hypothetical protein NEOKW01_1681 [Nematocida sp. AWRm80]
MGGKAQKPSPLSPLMSDQIWMCDTKKKDWKVVGNSSIERARSQSIVGDMSIACVNRVIHPWLGAEGYNEGRKRSMSTTAMPGLALRLGLEENNEVYRGVFNSLKDGVAKTTEDVKMEKGTLSTLRKRSLDPALFFNATRKEAEPVRAKTNLKPNIEKLCIVQFGSGYKCFGFYKEIPLSKGAFVIIEADRGEDCGAVIAIGPFSKTLPELAQKYSIASMEIRRVYRIATEKDKLLLLEQNELEQEALLICRERVRVRKLSMEIISAEYQWDRKKLTFYFKSDKRVDFKDLVRELYKIYEMRIWMFAIEKKPSKALPYKQYTLEDSLKK